MSWHWSSANKFFCPLDLKAICLGKVTSHRAYKNECSYTWFLRSHQNTSVWLTNLSRRAPVILRSYSSIWQGECWTVLLKSKLMRPWVMHWIFFFFPSQNQRKHNSLLIRLHVWVPTKQHKLWTSNASATPQ